MTGTYDIAFSLGFSCGGSLALRDANLQFASYPFDWTGTPGVVKSAKMVESDFAGWFERDDLRLVSVRGGTFQTNVYLNSRTGFGFPHDFSRFQTFEESFPVVAEKYVRRIARFMSAVAAAKRALAVYIGRPIDSRVPDGDLVEARRILSAKFPGTSFDILYFYRKEGAEGFIEESVADGVTAVACEYAKFDYGEISHAIKWEVQARYLREHFRLSVVPDAAASAKYEAESRAARKKRFKSRIDEWKYRIYRNLEKQLQEKELVPRDRPLWFY